MTGLVAKGVGSVRIVRTSIELSVLAVGALLGGKIGVGTVIYAFAIGPLLHILLPRLQVKSGAPASRPLHGSGEQPDGDTGAANVVELDAGVPFSTDEGR